MEPFTLVTVTSLYTTGLINVILNGSSWIIQSENPWGTKIKGSFLLFLGEIHVPLTIPESICPSKTPVNSSGYPAYSFNIILLSITSP